MKPHIRLLVAAVLLGGILFLSLASRPDRNASGYFLPNSVSPAEQGALTVLNLNMLHGFPNFRHLPGRLSLLQEALQILNPDIVLLQEVPWHSKVGNAAHMLAGDELAWAYARANGSRHILRFEEGVAILSRYPLEVVEVQELKPQPQPFEHRIVLHALVRLPHSDLHLFVTHLTHRDAEVNALQAAELYRYVESRVGDAPALIAGDFNARSNEPTLSQLVGWVDLFVQSHPEAAGLTCCANNLIEPSATPYERVDYIFYRPGISSPNLEIDDIEIIFDQPVTTPEGPLWLSDHFGLLARFVLPLKD